VRPTPIAALILSATFFGPSVRAQQVAPEFRADIGLAGAPYCFGKE
jgi:hypothetical protein